MKFIIATFFMLFSVLAQAQISIHDAGRAGFDKLSETEKAAIIQQIAEKNSNNVPIVGNITPEKLDRFAQTGDNIGKGLAAAAKEIGVTVNEFVQTPVGILTVGLIVWHVVGDDIKGILGGILVWIIGFAAIRFVSNRAYPIRYEYDMQKTNVFGNYVVKNKYRDDFSAEMTIFTMIASGFVVAVGIIVMV